MGVFDRQKAAATRLIAKYGEAAEYTNRPVMGTSVKPWEPTKSPEVVYSPRIAFLPISATKRAKREMKGADDQLGSQVAYMAAVEFNPTLKDTIRRANGSVFRIVAMDPLEPNGEGAIMYEMELIE